MENNISKETVFSVNKGYFNGKDPRVLGTTNKKEIQDLSPLLIDFVCQQKKIFLLDSGTGFGKSYSLNTFMGHVTSNKYLFNNINQIFYITDRRHNVQQEYDDFKRRFPREAELALPVKNNVDCILENRDVFERLSAKFKETNEYKSLRFVLNEYKPGNSIALKELTLEENKFRKRVKNILFSDYPELITKTYQQKINLLKNKGELSALLDLYPNILTRGKKILFLTIDKFFLQFDEIINKEVCFLYQNKDFMKNSIILLDESDAMAGTILDRVVEENSKNPIDLIEKTERFFYAMSSKKIPLVFGYNNQKINDAIKHNLREYEKLSKEFYLNYSLIPNNKDSTHWLYARQDIDAVFKDKDSKSQNIELDLIENQAIIRNRDEIRNASLASKDYGVFVSTISLVLRRFFTIIKMMADFYKTNYAKKENIESCIKKVLDFYHIVDFFSSDDGNNQELIRNISLISTKKLKNNDFYVDAGELTKTVLHSDRDFMSKLYSYQIPLTPEMFLKLIIDNGARIILSSATSKNKSLLRNFNLNWAPIKNEIFLQSKSASILEKNYYEKQEKNKSNVNVFVNKITQDINEKDILNFLKNKKAAKRYLSALKQSTDEYYYNQYIESIYDILYKLNKNVSATLMFFKFKLESGKKGFRELRIFFDSIIKKEYPSFKYFFADAGNLEEQIEGFKKSVNDGNNCFLITTYATAEKGLNLKIRRSIKTSEIVPLNDMGEKEIRSNLNKTKDAAIVNVDIDGIYLGDITFVYPAVISIKEAGPTGNISSILKAAYYVQSMEYGQEITNKELKNVFSVILAKNVGLGNTGFNKIQNYQDKPSYIFKLISTVIQSVGRKCRCNIRMKNNYITLNSSLCNKLNGKSSILLDEPLFDKQPFEVRKVIESLIDTSLNNSHNWFDENAPETAIYENILENNIYAGMEEDSVTKKDIEKTLVNAAPIFSEKTLEYQYNNYVLPAIEANNNGNPSLLKQLHCINSYSVSNKEFSINMRHPQKDLYFKCPEELKGKNGYTCNSKDGNNFFFICHPSNIGRKNVSLNNFMLSCEQKQILSTAGIKLNLEGYENDGYILTPYGFDIFVKNINKILSKSILKEYFSAIYCKINDMPDEIYSCDSDYIKVGSNILIIDYSVNDKINDDKLLKIKKYFSSMCDTSVAISVLRINALNLSDKDKGNITKESIDDFKILNINNIYENNVICPKIISNIVKIVDEYIN